MLYHYLLTGVVDIVLFEYLDSGVHGFGLELIISLLSSCLKLLGKSSAQMRVLVDAMTQVAQVHTRLHFPRFSSLDVCIETLIVM
jgi:hypothetical protein